MAGQDAIWHVIIDGEQHGPLSRAQVLEYLHDGQLVGGELIWRPGFSDWKSVSEVAEFWQPPKRGSQRPPPLPAPTEQPERDDDQIDAVATDGKWSIWSAANAGLRQRVPCESATKTGSLATMPLFEGRFSAWTNSHTNR